MWVMYYLVVPIYPCKTMKLLFVFQILQAVAGLAADGRQIVARAKSEATNYERFSFFFKCQNVVWHSLHRFHYMCSMRLILVLNPLFGENILPTPSHFLGWKKLFENGLEWFENNLEKWCRIVWLCELRGGINGWYFRYCIGIWKVEKK